MNEQASGSWYRPTTFTRSNADEVAECEARIAELKETIQNLEQRLDECRSSPDDVLWAGGWIRFPSAEFETAPESRVGGLAIAEREEWKP